MRAREFQARLEAPGRKFPHQGRLVAANADLIDVLEALPESVQTAEAMQAHLQTQRTRGGRLAVLAPIALVPKLTASALGMHMVLGSVEPAYLLLSAIFAGVPTVGAVVFGKRMSDKADDALSGIDDWNQAVTPILSATGEGERALSTSGSAERSNTDS